MKNTLRAQYFSTRSAFLLTGLIVAAWAALVPYAKARMDLDEASLGLLLLCMGSGSLIAMPLAGSLTARFGCRPLILWSGSITLALLPLLAWIPATLAMGCALLGFGAAIGTLEVAMNLQAVKVEKASGLAMMSGFHAMFSVGGFIGAIGMTLALSGLSVLAATLCLAVLGAILLWYAAPHFLRDIEPSNKNSPLFVMPHGGVVVLGILCFIVFLAEGAMLDWSALFLTATHGLAADRGGLGYAAFALSMTAGRLTGDRVVQRYGRLPTLFVGGLIAASGFAIAVSASSVEIALAGFVLVGLGAANIVPILFSAAGRQSIMPTGLAIGAVTTFGYAGILAGPALIGFVAHASSLKLAFAGLGVGLLCVAVSAWLPVLRVK